MKKQYTKQSKMQKRGNSTSLSVEEVAKQVDPESFVANYDATEFEYEDFWKDREYEFLTEFVLLKIIFEDYILKNKHYRIVNFLDLGGGYGRLTPLYTGKTGWRTVLGDYSLKELERAARRMDVDQMYIASDLVALNAYLMPFKDEAFDYIMSVRLIHHIKYVDKFFKEVARVLRPGGIFILEAAHKNHIKYVIKEFLKRKNFSFLKEDYRIVNHDPNQTTMSKKDEGKKISIIYNFSKNYIKRTAERHGFKLLNYYPCSFFRSKILKEALPPLILTSMDMLVRPFLKHLPVAPSIFYVFKKEGFNPHMDEHYDGPLVEDILQLLRCPNKRGRDLKVELQKDRRLLCKDDKGRTYDFGYKLTRSYIFDLRYPRPDNINF